MVSKEKINENIESVKELFNEYDSVIADLQEYWIGVSHNNLVNKATEFSTEFSKTIQVQFDYFSKLVEEYEQSIQKIDVAVNGEPLVSGLFNGEDNYISTNRVKAINDKIDSISDVKLDAATQNYNV